MVRDEYFALTGGINDVDPPTTVAPGFLRDAMNYEQGVRGGYRRIDGYERFDGQNVAPSDARSWFVTLEGATLTPAVNDHLVINTNRYVVLSTPRTTADGLLRIELGTPAMTISNLVSGYATHPRELDSGSPFTSYTVGHSPAFAYPAPVDIGRIARRTGADGALYTVPVDERRTTAAAEYMRGATQVVPGSGPVRGVFYFDGNVYAFRDNAAATACVMHRATFAGWQGVATPALLPGGRYEFHVDNFYGHANRRRLYGVDGVNPAFEFDGTTLTQIATGMTNDAPLHVTEYKRHLVLAFTGGSLQFSSLGVPTTFAAITGANEIACADEITGLLVLPNDALLVLCRNRTYVLYGTPLVNARLEEHSSTTGALPYTVQRLGAAVYADDRGLVAFEQVQSYGNFEDATFSQTVAGYYRAKKSRIVASTLVRDKNQYRVFFDDGDALFVTFDNRRVSGIMRARYPDVVRCVSNDELADGSEILCFGSDAGYVYRMDVGTSFDGADIEAYIKPVFNQLRSPERRKRFRRMVFDVRCTSGGQIAVQPEFSYGGRETMSARLDYEELLGSGADWDEASWNADEFSGEEVMRVPVKIDGTGVNLGCIVYSKSAEMRPHTLYGATVHFTPRRLER